jgi:DinB superfamily
MGELIFLSASLSGRLEHQHETIAELTRDISEMELKRRIKPDKWSSFENIVHLASYQVTFLTRVDFILTWQEPEFERYVAEKDPLFSDYLEFSLQQLLETIAADRINIIKKIAGCSLLEFSRVGLHPKFGRMTLVQWTEFFLLHEAHHIYSIFMETQELRRSG